MPLQDATSLKSSKQNSLPLLQFFSMLFLVPGIFGLIVSTILSTSYLANLPRIPDPQSLRMTPREIHGVTIFETVEEDRTLTGVEYGALGCFLIGLVFSVVYIEKRSAARASEGEQSAMGEA